MSKKLKPGERKSPLPYVSIKHKKTGMYARFIKYSDRVVICKLNISRKPSEENYRWWISTEFETRALRHPGSVEKEIPPDKFNEKFGMELAFRRGLKKFEAELKDIKKSIKDYETAIAEGRMAYTEMLNAKRIFEQEFSKYIHTDMLTCESLNK